MRFDLLFLHGNQQLTWIDHISHMRQSTSANSIGIDSPHEAINKFINARIIQRTSIPSHEQPFVDRKLLVSPAKYGEIGVVFRKPLLDLVLKSRLPYRKPAERRGKKHGQKDPHREAVAPRIAFLSEVCHASPATRWRSSPGGWNPFAANRKRHPNRIPWPLTACRRCLLQPVPWAESSEKAQDSSRRGRFAGRPRFWTAGHSGNFQFSCNPDGDNPEISGIDWATRHDVSTFRGLRRPTLACTSHDEVLSNGRRGP